MMNVRILTLMLVCALMAPSSGRAASFGVDPADPGPLRQGVETHAPPKPFLPHAPHEVRAIYAAKVLVAWRLADDLASELEAGA